MIYLGQRGGLYPNFGLALWCWGFWFRVFGYGFRIMQNSKHTPMFSERYGFVKAWRIGPAHVRLLTPPDSP